MHRPSLFAPWGIDQTASLIDIVQTVLLVVSAWLVVRQLRQTTQLARAANAQALVEHAGSFNALLIGNADLALLWYSGGKELPAAALDAGRYRYRELLVQWLIFHENIFYQKQRGLLDDHVYRSWDWDLRATVQNHDLAVLVGDPSAALGPGDLDRKLRDFFSGDFGAYLVELRNGTAPAWPSTVNWRRTLRRWLNAT